MKKAMYLIDDPKLQLLLDGLFYTTGQTCYMTELQSKQYAHCIDKERTSLMHGKPFEEIFTEE